MTKYQSLTIYGILMMVTGVILIALSYNPSQTMQYSVALTMLFSAAFAFWATYQSRNIPSSMKYHGLHALGMLIYGVAILFFATDIQIVSTGTTVRQGQVIAKVGSTGYST